MKNAPAEEKVEEGLTSKGGPWASSNGSVNDSSSAEAVVVGAAAAINASRRLNAIENGGGGGGGERNRFSPGYSVDFVAHCRPEGMNIEPAVSAPMTLDSEAKDMESAIVTSMLTVDLTSQGLDSDGGSDRRERGVFARGSGDCRTAGLDALEGSAKRPRLGVGEGEEACVGRGDSATMSVGGQGMSAGGRDSTERSAECGGFGVGGGATCATTAASAGAVAVDPVTAPYGKKRKKPGAAGKKKGAMTEKLRCLDDGVDIGESAKVRGSEIFLCQVVATTKK